METTGDQGESLPDSISLERGDLVVVKMDYCGPYDWPAIITDEVEDSNGQSFWVNFIQNRPTHDPVDRSEISLFASDSGPSALTAFDPNELVLRFQRSCGRPVNLCWLRSIERMADDYLKMGREERVVETDNRAGHFKRLEESRKVGKGRQRYCLCQTEMRKKTELSDSLMVMCHDCKFWYHLKCLKQATKKDADGLERLRYPSVCRYEPLTDKNKSYWSPWYCPICLDSDSDGLVEDEILPVKISVDKKESKGRGRPKKIKLSGPGDEGMAPVEE